MKTCPSFWYAAPAFTDTPRFLAIAFAASFSGIRGENAATAFNRESTRFKGAMKTIDKFGSLERPRCPDNDHTSFMENFAQIMEILNETREAVATP